MAESPPVMSQADFDLGKLISILWSGKWVVVATTVLAVAVAAVVAFSLPERYEARAMLVPASKSGTSSLSRLADQLGGLTALAGIRLGMESGADETAEAIELLKSWDFQETLIRENGLEVPLFAAKGWNRSDGSFRIDPDIYDPDQKKWTRKYDAAAGQTAQPSGWELHQKLAKSFSVYESRKTGFVTIAVENYSPFLAKEIVDLMIDGVNKRMQDRSRREALQNIQYLEERLRQTNLSEMKLALAKLIEDQTRRLMLADVSEDYVLKRISAVKVPERKSFPPKLIILVAGALGGFVLSCMGLMLWSGLRDRAG
jgi:uncharacterized protein involved in exopolysaccharide biosynthesis